MYGLQKFSAFLWVVFIFFMVSMTVFILVCFFFCHIFFGVLSDKPVLFQGPEDLLLFSSKTSIISVVTFCIKDPFWVKFCVWCKEGLQIHFSRCGYPGVPAALDKKSILAPIGLSCQSCWKWTGHVCEGLFLDSQFYSIDLYVCPWRPFYISSPFC